MSSIFHNFKINWKSGITVALVSIPLSVSLAVASESAPTAGIITAIWAGLVASFFGGSHYNIVGPTGALSGILAAYALTHGASSLEMIAIIAGAMILVAYLLKLQRFLIFVPASTMHGFTIGVALIIALNQMNFALGLSGLEKHEKFIDNVIESISNIQSVSVSTCIVFLVFLLGLFTFLKFLPKIPGAIILTPFGIALGYLSVSGRLPFQLETLGSRFADIAPKLFLPFHFLPLSSELLVCAATVALVAILETMLSAKIADGMTKTKHNERQEILGLGLANIASGLFGGIPATAALARTSLNIKTGATDKLSATISSVSIAVISLLLLTYFRYIPLAVIAAILVFVAIRMVEAHHFVRMFRLDRMSFFLALAVATVTVYEDPIIGILFGTAISLIIFMEKLSRGQFDLIVNDENKKIIKKVTGEKLEDLSEKSDTLVYSIKGQLAYINSQSHLARFAHLNGYKHVVIRLRELYFIDYDGVEAFEEIIELIHAQGKQVLISGVNPLIENMLNDNRAYQQLQQAQLVFPRTTDALQRLGF